MNTQNEKKSTIRKLSRLGRPLNERNLTRTKGASKITASASLILGVIAGCVARASVDQLNQAQLASPISYAKEIAAAVGLAAGWIGLLKHLGSSRPLLLFLIGFSLGFGYQPLSV